MGWELLLNDKIVHKAATLGTEGDIEVPLMVKMPSGAGGLGFAEWRGWGYPKLGGEMIKKREKENGVSNGV